MIPVQNIYYMLSYAFQALQAQNYKDLATEKKIFGKDFAYIRNITGFSKIVGRYLTKQLEDDE